MTTNRIQRMEMLIIFMNEKKRKEKKFSYMSKLLSHLCNDPDPKN